MERVCNIRFDDKYKGKFVIVGWILYKDFDNVIEAFDNLEDGLAYLEDIEDMDDFYLYEIKEDGYAYGLEY